MNTTLRSRLEVLTHLEKDIKNAVSVYLKPIEEIWQPADLVPDAANESFYDEVKELQQRVKGLSNDLLAVLIGNTITEEALPNYESWLLSLNNLRDNWDGPWAHWVRAWTAEENRHGDVLNKYLYLSGRINMREMEISTQYLIADGFDLITSKDPYSNFVYTSFQELATNMSHRRVAQFAKESGDNVLAKLCGNVAADEARHANAYKSFVSGVFEVDPSEMMIAFKEMMRRGIVMPAHFLRESGLNKGASWNPFSDTAQRLGVYTGFDYVTILKTLIEEWKIDSITCLTDAGERARDFLMALPARLQKIAERSKPTSSYTFSWINR